MRGRFIRKEDTTRINEAITAPKVRLIDQDRNNKGVVSIEEAKRMAEEAGLDIVEVSPNSDPPVCRIMEYSKYRYEKQKREKAAKHGGKAKQLKEIRLSPKIGIHDLEIKARHARKFLEEGHRVQLTMRFRGREIAHDELGRKVLEQMRDMLAEVAKVEVPPYSERRRMYLLLVPSHEKSTREQSGRLKTSETADAE